MKISPYLSLWLDLVTEQVPQKGWVVALVLSRLGVGPWSPPWTTPCWPRPRSLRALCLVLLCLLSAGFGCKGL